MIQRFTTVCLVTLFLVACNGGDAAVTEADDLSKIENLHQRDQRASVAQDHEMLASLWTKDAVTLSPGGPRLRGQELFETLLSERPDPSYEVLEYEFDFEEVKISGDYAFEWGVLRGKTRDLATGTVDESKYKVLRILHKENGEWKVHRAMWNTLE